MPSSERLFASWMFELFAKSIKLLRKILSMVFTFVYVRTLVIVYLLIILYFIFVFFWRNEE